MTIMKRAKSGLKDLQATPQLGVQWFPFLRMKLWSSEKNSKHREPGQRSVLVHENHVHLLFAFHYTQIFFYN